MFRRYLLILVVAAAGLFSSPAVETVSACPMCKVATEEAEEQNLPQAMMYSILFMLTIPACIFSGIGIGLWKMSRREAGDLAHAEPPVDQPSLDA